MIWKILGLNAESDVKSDANAIALLDFVQAS